MQNDVLSPRADGAIGLRWVDRSLERQRSASANVVRRLVEASFQLIREGERLEPRVGEIVRAAGVSNQAFYKHFRSKDELLLAVLDEGVQLLAGYLEHRMAAAPSAAARVREWVAGILEQALNAEAAAATRPFVSSRARLAELFPEEVRESEARLTTMLRDALTEARADGALPEVDPALDTEMLYDLAMGWMGRKLAAPATPSRADAELLVDFALHGLRRGSSQ